jgi:hypothetical protein
MGSSELLTESDVEQKLLFRLLTDESLLGIPAERIRTKQYLVPTAIDKQGGKTSGYVPDYAIWIDALPVMVVEAKAPDVEAAAGYREATLYAFHLNKQFKSSLNPSQRVLATNGVKVLAGKWDADPEFDKDFAEITPGSPALEELRKICGYEALQVLHRGLLSKVRPKQIVLPFSLIGGKSVLNAPMTPNTFAAPLSPILKRYFSSRQQNSDPEIYRDAYINSKVNSTHDEILDSLMRERIVDLRGSLSTTLEPSKRREKNVQGVIQLFKDTRPPRRSTTYYRRGRHRKIAVC